MSYFNELNEEKKEYEDLEIILLSGHIQQDELEHYDFNEIGKIHNDNYTYSNKEYTIIIRERFNTPNYTVKSYWLNNIDG